MDRNWNKRSFIEGVVGRIGCKFSEQFLETDEMRVNFPEGSCRFRHSASLIIRTRECISRRDERPINQGRKFLTYTFLVGMTRAEGMQVLGCDQNMNTKYDMIISYLVAT